MINMNPFADLTDLEIKGLSYGSPNEFDAHNLDISDPVNVKEKERVFGAFDNSMQKVIDDLVNMRTSKTEPGVIEKQIQSQYEGTPLLADAMAYYLYKSKTTRVPTPVVPPTQ